MRRPALAAALTLAALTVATLTVGPGIARAAKQPAIKVTITNDGCPKKLKAEAGRITFTVTNDNATKVSEFEVMKGDKILGEIENVAPGLTRSFSVTLEPGKYQSYCPHGKRENGAVVVSAAP